MAAPLIERPTRADDVAAAIRDARGPIELMGGGTKRNVGAPVAAETLLDLSGLDVVVAYEPDELVLTIGAGAALADVEAMLAASNQHLAFEPPDFRRVLGSEGKPTIGGMLAAGIGGPRRVRDGGPRDHFLGFEAVGGDGIAFKAGGRVVKNVTGFDLPKLLAGSWGTLAALTVVTVKALPRPQFTTTLAIDGLCDAAAVAAMNEALGWPADISGAAHIPGDVPVTLLRLEGFPPSVVGRAAMLRDRLGALGSVRTIDDAESAVLWRDIRDAAAFAGDDRLLWRFHVPASRAAEAVAAIRANIAAKALYDWGGALVWLATDGAGEAIIPDIARRHGGHAILFRAPEDVRRRVALFAGQQPGRAALEARIRSKFDPADKLNPGRLGTG